MNTITVVSLGPGDRGHLTLQVQEALRGKGAVLLRTGQTDAAKALAEWGVAYETLDDLHETSEDFDAFVRAACDRVIRAAGRRKVVYAVLDASADETVRALRERCGDHLRDGGGMALSTPLLRAAGVSGAVTIAEAASLRVGQTQDPVLITELSSRLAAGECKLKLLPWYGADCPVQFFAPSQKAERTCETIPLEDLDRQKRYDHTCACLMPSRPLTEKSRYNFTDLVQIMRILRGGNGCEWDRAQTHASLTRYLIEEAYEVSQAVGEEDWQHTADELGDVLLQVVFHADIGEQYGTLDLSDITTAICRKMISRHPHIFGNGDRMDWDQLKLREHGQSDARDAVRNVGRGLPALLLLEKMITKGKKAGLDTESLTCGPAPECVRALIHAAEEVSRRGLCPEEEIHRAAMRVMDAAEEGAHE